MRRWAAEGLHQVAAALIGLELVDEPSPCYAQAMTYRFAFALVVLVACGDSGTGGSGAGGSPGTGGEPAGGESVAGGGGSDGGSGGAGPAGGGEVGGGACLDTSRLVYGPGPAGEPSCLDVPSANVFCGFGSDEEICEFSVSCGHSEDLGQCKINCEQGSSAFCNDMASVDCVVAAYCSEDCEALAACTFIL